MPEQPYFEVMSWSQGTLAQERGEVPMWSDLTVQVKILSQPDGWVKMEDDDTVTLCVTRGAGEAIIDSIYEVLHPYAGRSIAHMMEQRLDEVVERLMSKKAEPGDKELARGMAMIIAIIHAPLNPNWEYIRDMAVERYHNTH